MSTNLEIVKKYWENESKKDLNGILDCYNADATFKAPISEALKGTEALKEFYQGVIEGFASSQVEVRRSTESGDRIAVEFTLHFEQHDGKKGQAQGCNVFTIRSGKIQDVRCYFDPSEFSA